MMRLGTILKNARGKESRVQFARKLELSYTFVRAMEHGLRFPSDKVLLDIAERLSVNPEELLLAAYCDRSPQLTSVLKRRGLAIPVGSEEEEGVNELDGEMDVLQPQAASQSSPAAAIRAHDPF